MASSGRRTLACRRGFGTFLSWLNDHESDVFVVCTCNDISKLPPEFARAERFDGIFFLDLPGRQQKDAIWDIFLEMFELDRDQARPTDDQWTGAEIRACCRLAALLDVPLTAAAQNVVPVAVTASESVERLRTWASGGASMPKRLESTTATATGRRSPLGRSAGAIRRITDVSARQTPYSPVSP